MLARLRQRREAEQRAREKAGRLAAKEATRRERGERGISDEQRRRLARMREDNAAAPDPYRATAYWTELNARFDAWFESEGIGAVETQGYNRLFSAADPNSTKYYDYALWMLYLRVRDRDVHGVLDRVAATAPDAKQGARALEGRRVSWDLLISVDTLYSVEELGGPSPWTDEAVVLDLGSGWGRIGHVLLSANPRATYVAVDLPESLLVAGDYLPRQLPEGTPVRPYEELRELSALTADRLRTGRGAWFCGTHDLPRFADRSIDHFLNVASFQEMTRDQVTAYLRDADRITAHGVYLQEIWHAERHGLQDVAIGGFDEYDVPERWERVLLRNATFTEKSFEAGFRVPPA